MAKNTEPTAGENTPEVAQVEQEIPLTVEEFCARQSATDNRVEMLGAFYRTEMAAGRVKGVQSEFANRYNAFINQPA